MKTSDQQPDQSKEFPFYRQRIVKSPTNKSNSNYITTDFTTKPLISKIQINFPKIKICESRKDITQDQINQIDKSLTNDHSHIPTATNTPGLKDNYQQSHYAQLNHYQPKSPNPHHQQYTTKRQRSPVRYNQYSYQQTTKQDYSQNNTSSYHDFFKVPIQLNNTQNQPFNHIPPSLKDLEIPHKNHPHQKSIDPFTIQPKEYYKNLLSNEKTNKNNKFQPILTSPKSQPKLIETPIKQKGNLTLSQLLTDLQKKSQKLYEIYGQNNEDYQKCIETIQKNEKSQLENNYHISKPSFFHQHEQPKKENFNAQQNEFKLPQPTYAYTDSKSDHYDSWKNLQSRKQLDFSKKSFESQKNELTKRYYQPVVQTTIKSSNRMQQISLTDELIFEKKSHEHATYTPIKEKNPLTYDKPYESADKKMVSYEKMANYELADKKMINSSQNFNQSTKGIITTSRSLSKQPSSIIEKKKKVMFYSEQNDQQEAKIQQKVSQFVNRLTKFFNKLLIDYIKANYFYETGVLSTESNIHATSGRNAEELMGDKSKQSNKQTSFFQEYFEKKDKNTAAEVIVCNMMGGGIRNQMTINQSLSAKKSKQQDILTPYTLLPIEEQLQSSYGLSMMGKSQQRKQSQQVQKQSVIYGQQEDKGSKRNDEQTQSRFREHVNSGQSRKVQELLIYSVDKNFLKNNLTVKKQLQVNGKRRQIDLQRFSIGLDKIVQIMKYKVLTQLRYGYLTLKFINPNYTGKQGISSLKISQVGRHSRERNQRVRQQHKSPTKPKQQHIIYQSRNTNINNLLSPRNVPNQPMVVNSPIKQQIHQPRNILEHYYKKSSPNSQTNEYSSIIDERQASPGRNRINSGYEKGIPNQMNEVKRSQYVGSIQRQVELQHQLSPLQQGTQSPTQSLKQPNPLKQSHLLLSPKHTQSPPEIIQQDYYAIGLTNSQQSKLSRQRTSRALSSASSRITITHGVPQNINQQRITKESFLSMRQSHLPVYSPTSTGSKFGHNLPQQQSVEKRESIDPLMNKQIYASGIQQVPVSSNVISSMKNSQMFQNPQTTHQQRNPLHVLRPLQPQQKKLDYYNSKGKISRSYSESDFKNYQHHFLKQLNTIRPTDTIRPNDMVQINPLSQRSQQQNIASSSMGRQRAETFMGMSNINHIQPNNILSVKSSAILNGQIKASNIIAHQIPRTNLLSKNHFQPASSIFSQIPNIPSQNTLTIANIPPLNSKTIRPIINPSMQKRRSQSLSSLIHGSSMLNGLNPGSNTPSMFKQLEGKPFIQFKHQNYATQHQIMHQVRPNTQIYQGANIQNQVSQVNRVPFHGGLMMENRQRVSKSMDQCMIRPSSFSGYNLGNSGVKMYQNLGNGINQSSYQINPQIQQQVFYGQQGNLILQQQPTGHIQQLSRPASNMISQNANLVISPSKTMQKHVEVESEYHMLKNNYNSNGANRQIAQTAGINGHQMNTPMKRSNQMMKVVSDTNGRGSRVKYQEQNLIIKNASTKQSTQISQSPQYISSYQRPYQRVQSPVQNSQALINRTPTSPSIKSSTITTEHLGTVNIPKPKSPSVLPKAKSPQTIKTKPLSVKHKQGRLSNYGQM